MPTRIVIADDHGVLRAGLRALLNEETNYEVVGEAKCSNEALSVVLELKPDFVLIDLSMPGVGGIAVTRQITTKLPDTKVLILTVHEDAVLLREAMRAGAAGYVVKRAVGAELIEAIETVRRGDLYVHPSMTRALLSEAPHASPPSQRGDNEALTGREVEVLRLLVRGCTNRQIAEDLFLSVRTVESHRANIMQKLELSSRADLVRWAAEHGLTG